MSLILLVVSLMVVGVFLWMVNAYIPMDGKIKTILNAVIEARAPEPARGSRQR